MKKRDCFQEYRKFFLILIFFVLLGITSVSAKHSVLYGGGPLYSDIRRHFNTVQNSGFTTIVLWTLHIQEDGDLVFNDKKIVDDGVYVGRSQWPAEIAALKTTGSTVNRIEISIGSWGVEDFERIESLIDSQGTAPGSPLYENFKAIRESLPAIDAVSYDDESNYDVESTEALSLMLNDLGFRITLCPYTASGFWSSVYSNVNSLRPGAIDRVYLQCYAGGAGNNPGTWNNYFDGLRVTPGLWCYPNGQVPSEIESRMSSWNSSYNIAGGFMWLFDDMIPHQSTYPPADYASAINNSLGIDPSKDLIASFHKDCDYSGWAAESGVDNYTTADILNLGGEDNEISSVKVKPGYSVTLYENDDFQGETLTITSDNICLIDEGWNDRASSAVVEVNPDPVAHWAFNEASGSTVSDLTGNGYAGQLKNMDSSSRVFGKHCGGLSFDGVDDYVEIADFKGITGSFSRTCTGWIKTAKDSGQTIISWGSSQPGAEWVIRTDDEGMLRLEASGGYISGTTDIADGQWHHIAIVLKEDSRPTITDAVLYVDGQPESISNSDSSALYTAGIDNVKIGAYSTNSDYFEGIIDEVRIYGRALSDSEIRGVYLEDALPGDIDSDGKVRFSDFAVLADLWGDSNDSPADLNCNGSVDISDLAIMVDKWLDNVPLD